MAELFTLQRLKLPPSLYKCLATTNLIESPQSGVARRTANVKHWRDQRMVEPWAASACYSPKTVAEKSPAIVTCGRWPRFTDAKPLKSRRRK